jgi:importin subunit alpha-1
MTDLLALLAEQIRGDDPILQLDAVTKIRKLLTLENTPPVQQVLALNILHRVVHFLASESPELQFEAAWTLTNIASGSSPETRAVVDADAVRHLVALLRSPHNQVREQAVWALGNIAGDSPHCRDHVLSHGAMPLLLDCFSDMTRDSLVRNAIWTLSNFCRGKPQPSFDIVRPALAVLAFMIRGDDTELLSDACWALSYLSDGSNDKIQAVLDAGVLPRVVQLLDHQAFTVQTPALRCVGNIVTGDDQQTQKVIDSNALAHLAKLLKSTKRSIRKEACWAISNITGGDEAQIQAVIDSGVVPTLVSMLGTAPLEIKKEACWALTNAIVGGTPAQIDHLVQCEVVRPLVDMLAVPDVKVTALEGLDKMLRVCGASAVEQALSAGILAAFDDSLFASTAIALRVIEQCASVDAGSVLESGLLSKVASLPYADLTLEMEQSIVHTVFLCYNSATPKQLDDLVDTGIFSQMYVIRDRAATICIAMQDLELPALVTLELLDAAFPNDIPMHKKWQLATAIKHFHRA